MLKLVDRETKRSALNERLTYFDNAYVIYLSERSPVVFAEVRKAEISTAAGMHTFYAPVEDWRIVNDVSDLFGNKKNLIKYFQCVAVGIPIWFVVGLLIMNSKDDFGPYLGLNSISNGYAVMYAYIGLSAGDLVAGMLSQLLRSRRKVVMIFLSMTLLVTLSFLYGAQQLTEQSYYVYCFLLGASTGYWAIFVTIAAEQFGTNIRSTAANTIPNFVRGSVFIIVSLFVMFQTIFDTAASALLVALLSLTCAIWGIYHLKETFSKDLNYHEEFI